MSLKNIETFHEDRLDNVRHLGFNFTMYTTSKEPTPLEKKIFNVFVHKESVIFKLDTISNLDKSNEHISTIKHIIPIKNFNYLTSTFYKTHYLNATLKAIGYQGEIIFEQELQLNFLEGNSPDEFVLDYFFQTLNDKIREGIGYALSEQR